MNADQLDTDLRTMFGAQPPPAILDRIDHRIEERLRTWDPSVDRRSRLRLGRRVGLIGVIATALAIGGANGNLQALYLLAVGPFDVPWQRGEAIGLSQVVDGYRVTLDRVYADATRVALAISVVDEEERPGITQVMAMGAVVTDIDGEYGGMGATSIPDGPFAAVNVAWKEPPILPLPSGPRAFQVVIPAIGVRDDSMPPPGSDDTWSPWREHPGPWTFEFTLDVDGGTTIEPQVTAEVDDVAVVVSRVIAAPGIVRVEARVDGVSPDEGWGPVGSISHGGRSAPFTAISFEEDGSFVAYTGSGLGSADGPWTITIDELVGSNERLAGPWVLEFEGP